MNTTPHPTGAQVAQEPWTIYPHPLTTNVIPIGCFELEDGTGHWTALTQNRETAERIKDAVNSHATLTAELAALRAEKEAMSKAIELLNYAQPHVARMAELSNEYHAKTSVEGLASSMRSFVAIHAARKLLADAKESAK